jgi:hypothetical protein
MKMRVGISFLLAIGLIMVFSPPSARAWDIDFNRTTLNGEPTIDWGPSKKELQERQDRQDAAEQKARAKKDAAEEAAANTHREAAYASARKARNKKVQHLTGRKVTSWQLLHR